MFNPFVISLGFYYILSQQLNYRGNLFHFIPINQGFLTSALRNNLLRSIIYGIFEGKLEYEKLTLVYKQEKSGSSSHFDKTLIARYKI